MSRRERKVPRWLRIKRARELERRALTRAERERARGNGWVIAWIVIVTLAGTVVGLGCLAPRARGAARVPIAWTAPATARSYEAITRRPDGMFLALTLSGDSASVTPLPIAPAGSPQSAWVLISTDWRAGGWMVWVRGCNAAGCAPWSNAVVLAAGLPDTVWHLQRLGTLMVRPPLEGREFKRASGRVGWGLDPADSVTAATIEHQELAQLRERPRLCLFYGVWALRGGLQACP